MAHGARLHTLEKRLPGPEPGLVGDVVNGVETVVSDVVGVVTTVVSDVVELVSPERSTAATTQPASSAGGGGGGSSAQATATATSPNAATSSPSGGTTGGGSSGNNNGGGSPDSGSSSSNGGSGSSSGNSDSGSTSDSGSDTGSSQVTGSSNTGTSLINASGALGASPTVAATNAALGSATSGVGSESVIIASRSGTGLVNLVEPTSLVESGGSANPSANSQESDSVSGGTRASGTLQNGATPSGTSHRSSTTTTTSGSGSGSGGDDGSVNGNGASSANGSGALSPGAIAGITIACSLVLIFLVVFVLRKWYRKRRARRFEHWVSRPGAFSFFGGAAVSVNSEKERSIDGSGGRSGSGSGTRSARSSFGTSYDQGLRPLTPDSFFNAPSPASVSEIHASANTPTSFLTAPVIPPPVARSVEHTGNAGTRQSLISLGTSDSSSYDTDGAGFARSHSHANTSTEAVAEEVNGSVDEHAQYLLAPPPHERGSPGGAQQSPISVRPWSPSERWAFPKPPQTAAQSTVYSTTPSPASQSAHVEQMAASAHVPLSAVTTPTAEQDPFADAALAATASRRASDVSAATDNAVTAHTSASGADELSGAVEQIRRPFVPTLADELRVNRGDVIRVLQAFDDGWVQVEILSRASSSNNGALSGSATAAASPGLERGLIPVDCLREAGEALPTFLASRRVSSQYGGIAI